MGWEWGGTGEDERGGERGGRAGRRHAVVIPGQISDSLHHIVLSPGIAKDGERVLLGNRITEYDDCSVVREGRFV